MIILYGWGEKSKKLGDGGLIHCNNCNNLSWFTIRYLVKEFNLYFIPVARWNRRYYLVCDICNAGFELDNKNIKNILADAKGTPDYKTYNLILERLSIIWDEIGNRYKNISTGIFKDWDNEANNRLRLDGFSETQIDYVLKIFDLLLEENLSKNKKFEVVDSKELTENSFYCRYCGNKLYSGSLFCSNCGKES